MGRKQSRIIQAFLACFLGIAGIMVAVTTLTVMAHANRWHSFGDELTGTPLIIVGFAAAAGAIVWLVALAESY